MAHGQHLWKKGRNCQKEILYSILKNMFNAFKKVVKKRFIFKLKNVCLMRYKKKLIKRDFIIKVKGIYLMR